MTAADSLLTTIAHHGVAFGLPLLLLPLVLVPWFARSSASADARADGLLDQRANHRVRVTLVAGAALGFALPNVVVYGGSWDIVKLYTAAGYLAGIGLALTLASAWRRASDPTGSLVWQGTLTKAIVLAAVVVTVAFPLAWLSTRTVLQGHFAVPVKNDWRLRDEVLEIGERVRPLIAKDAKVLINDVEHARMTGLSAPGFNAQ